MQIGSCVSKWQTMRFMFKIGYMSYSSSNKSATTIREILQVEKGDLLFTRELLVSSLSHCIRNSQQ